MTWYDEYKDLLVGFVVATRHGQFKGIIGRCIESDGDDDCVVNVVATMNNLDSLEDVVAEIERAQATLEGKDRMVRVFKKPNESGGMMGHWLLPIVWNETGEDPRKGGGGTGPY